jgi:aerobic carbon-monoxide dehydrogenase large subunit
MRAFGTSQGGTRREDIRFLTGQGRYLADILPDDALHAVFLRAPVAHARITALEVAEARDMPGIRAIWTAAELDAAGVTGSVLGITLPDQRGGKGAAPHRPALAREIMRHVGEPVALILAETRAQALDALDAIVLEYEDLPVALALAPGGPVLHPQAPDNIALDWALGDSAATEAAFARAAHVTRLTVRQNRVTAAALEPRAAFAQWDGARLHFAFNGQGVWTMKRELAQLLGLDPDQVHVTTPDVGGGFGMKVMVYPEHVALAAAARALGCAAAWVAERGESIASDNGARDLTSMAELAFDADHRILGYRVNSRFNLGAYNSQFGQNIQTALFSKVFTGVYDIPAAHLQVQGIYTNTTPVDAYRGAGRPEAITLLERAMDMAARELGLSPFALRARNFIPATAFPYATPAGENYDVGDFARVQARAEDLADVAGFGARKADSAARGMLRGLGVAYYIEAILGDASETATLEFTDTGRARLYVGTQSNGQGHETVYARHLATSPFSCRSSARGRAGRGQTGRQLFGHSARQLVNIGDRHRMLVIARHVMADADGDQFHRLAPLDHGDHIAQVLFQIVGGVHRQGGIVHRRAIRNHHHDLARLWPCHHAAMRPFQRLAVDIFLEQALFHHQPQIGARAPPRAHRRDL